MSAMGMEVSEDTSDGPTFLLAAEKRCNVTRMGNEVVTVSCPHLQMNAGVAKVLITIVTNVPSRSFVPTRMHVALQKVPPACIRNTLKPFEHVVKAGYPRTRSNLANFHQAKKKLADNTFFVNHKDALALPSLLPAPYRLLPPQLLLTLMDVHTLYFLACTPTMAKAAVNLFSRSKLMASFLISLWYLVPLTPHSRIVL
jgi:hypothetical protein